MSARRIIAALFITLVAGSCAAPATAVSKTSGPLTTPSPSAPAASADGLGERRHEAGAVTVAASWIAGTASARVVLETHSVDLDGFDLTGLARLRIDGGAWIAPTAWDAPKGGHHRSGALDFGSLDPAAIASARVIELEIRDVAVPAHLLRWERGR